MDIYHIHCNLKAGQSDLGFVRHVRAYLDHLASEKQLQSYRITRAKLGLRPPQLREFLITLEFNDLGQLQSAFDNVSTRADPVEGLHHAVNSMVEDTYFALYRDFPDEGRVQGQGKF